jgi:hypothetical protein
MLRTLSSTLCLIHIAQRNKISGSNKQFRLREGGGYPNELDDIHTCKDFFFVVATVPLST